MRRTSLAVARRRPRPAAARADEKLFGDSCGAESPHCGGQRWWATLRLLPHVYGSPQGPSRSSHLHLEEHERFELRLKIGYHF